MSDINVPQVGMTGAVREPLEKLVEAVGQILARLDSLDTQMGNLVQQMGRIEIEVGAMKTRMSRVEDTIAKVAYKVGAEDLIGNGGPRDGANVPGGLTAEQQQGA